MPVATAEICIIGAGPAGLAALKTLLDSPRYRSGDWRPTVFEAREDVGGVWLPSPGYPSNSRDPQRTPSTPLYDSLTTNLPHPVMSFSSYMFPPGTPLFPRASVVETYLRDYASHFRLLPHIHFRTRVNSVACKGTKWAVHVTTQSDTGPQSHLHEFDLVLVCNGHHNVPRYPSIPGIQTWLDANMASHSMFYRNPVDSIPISDLSKATILVVGGGPSGTDVASDLLGVASRVILSSSGNAASPEKVVNKPRASNFDIDEKTVTFADGSTEKVDYCILATGYEVDLPFFNQNTSNIDSDINSQFNLPKLLSWPVDLASKKLINSTWGVSPLARHLFPFPGFLSSPGFSLASLLRLSSAPSTPPPTSLAFLGLLVRVAPLPLLECQARAALAAFANPAAIQWDAETAALVQRKQALKMEFLESGNPPDEQKVDEYITKQWERVPDDAQFAYRDSLDEFSHQLSGGADPGSPQAPPHKSRSWEREMYANKAPLRAAWRALEARGEADGYVAGVGRGHSIGEDGKMRTPEEEWVDLMRRVLRWWEHEGKQVQPVQAQAAQQNSDSI